MPQRTTRRFRGGAAVMAAIFYGIRIFQEIWEIIQNGGIV